MVFPKAASGVGCGNMHSLPPPPQALDRPRPWGCGRGAPRRGPVAAHAHAEAALEIRGYGRGAPRRGPVARTRRSSGPRARAAAWPRRLGGHRRGRTTNAPGVGLEPGRRAWDDPCKTHAIVAAPARRRAARGRPPNRG